MECVQSLFLSGVRSPRLAAIEEGAEDALYTATFIWMVSLPFSQTHLSKLAKGEAARPMCLSVSVSRARSTDTVEPRYVNSFTTSNFLLLTLISGGCLTPWHMLVFRMLMVMLKSRLAREKLSMMLCSCCSV